MRHHNDNRRGNAGPLREGAPGEAEGNQRQRGSGYRDGGEHRRHQGNGEHVETQKRRLCRDKEQRRV